MNSNHTVVDSVQIPAMETGHSQVQFIGTPEMIGSNSMAVILGTVPGPGMVHLHSHADPECFYILDGEMEVYQESSGKDKWTQLKKGYFAAIHGNVKHAWRNTSSCPCVALIFTGGDVHAFLRGVCELIQAHVGEEGLSPDAITKIQELAVAHHAWIGSLEENAAIGLKLT